MNINLLVIAIWGGILSTLTPCNLIAIPTMNKTGASQKAFVFFTIFCVVVATTIILALNNQNPQDPNQINNPSGTITTTTTNTENPSSTYKLTQTVTTISGKEISLSSYSGVNVIFYFTGASCVPCKMQLPYLVAAYNAYKSTGKIEVISFDIQGTSITNLETWVEDNEVSWVVCQDTNVQMASYFSIFSMPTLVICDENGQEITRYVGAQDQTTINTIFANLID